jgi:hypothetical protein
MSKRRLDIFKTLVVKLLNIKESVKKLCLLGNNDKAE